MTLSLIQLAQSVTGAVLGGIIGVNAHAGTRGQQVAGLKEDVRKLNNTVENLNGKINKLEGEIAKKEQEIKELSKKIKE